MNAYYSFWLFSETLTVWWKVMAAPVLFENQVEKTESYKS